MRARSVLGAHRNADRAWLVVGRWEIAPNINERVVGELCPGCASVGVPDANEFLGLTGRADFVVHGSSLIGLPALKSQDLQSGTPV